MNDTITSYDVTAMNIIIAIVVILSVAFLAAWASSPTLRAWIEKPNQKFQSEAQRFDEALKASTMAKGRDTL